MKIKKGFTLVEVLTTLTLIGVIAALTIPTFTSNAREQRFISSYKKVVNTLNEAGQANKAIQDFDYNELSDGTDGPSNEAIKDGDGILKKSLWAILADNLKIDVANSIIASVGGECEGLSQIFFRDGTVLCYTPEVTNSIDDTIAVWIDVNGTGGPNMKSECESIDCFEGERSINDQYPATLHGSNAYPGNVTFENNVPVFGNAEEDFAARWALSQ